MLFADSASSKREMQGKAPWHLLLLSALLALSAFLNLSWLTSEGYGNINLESLLALTVLLAAWAFILAAETGRLRWLIVGALVVGVGFNVKMLEVFMVLPAFYLMYIVAARVGWRRRIIHLGLATIVIVAASLPWVVTVDLTPA